MYKCKCNNSYKNKYNLWVLMIKIPTAFKLLKAWPVMWIKCFVIFDFINFFSPFSSTNTVIAKKYTTLFPRKNQIFRYYFHQLNICIKNRFIKHNIIKGKLVCVNVSSGVCFFFVEHPHVGSHNFLADY